VGGDSLSSAEGGGRGARGGAGCARGRLGPEKGRHSLGSEAASGPVPEGRQSGVHPGEAAAAQVAPRRVGSGDSGAGSRELRGGQWGGSGRGRERGEQAGSASVLEGGGQKDSSGEGGREAQGVIGTWWSARGCGIKVLRGSRCDLDRQEGGAAGGIRGGGGGGGGEHGERSLQGE